MFFKKNAKTKIDTNYVKQEIINWTVSQNVEIHMIEILLGDYRDGSDLSNKVGVFAFFKTNTEFQEYKDNGFVSKLKEEVIRLLKDIVFTQDKQIDFIFDSHENVELNYNGNYLQYNKKNNANKVIDVKQLMM